MGQKHLTNLTNMQHSANCVEQITKCLHNCSVSRRISQRYSSSFLYRLLLWLT